MNSFPGNIATITTELADTLARVDPHQVDRAVDAILSAGSVFVIGVGREGLAARGFAMRLAHLGLRVHWGWDDTTPAVTADDTMIMVNGSGSIGHLDYVFARVRAVRATTVVVTAIAEAETPRAADVALVVPATVYRGDGDLVASIQPMGSLFEQCTQLVFDAAVLQLTDRLGLGFADLAARHRNFE
ncbi:SIS domain-containing protein [Glaciibacter sp. 2TAF33]|uniref:SIS domain-containing protein n=1 Tax=Glaciibacter sp. 2TAF33 TaxID=3233015 RepID=UPI003F924BDE